MGRLNWAHSRDEPTDNNIKRLPFCRNLGASAIKFGLKTFSSIKIVNTYIVLDGKMFTYTYMYLILIINLT